MDDQGNSILPGIIQSKSKNSISHPKKWGTQAFSPWSEICVWELGYYLTGVVFIVLPFIAVRLAKRDKDTILDVYSRFQF